MTEENGSDDLYISSDIESAIIQGKMEEFQSLVEDANLSHRSDNGSTLLHEAAITGRPEIAAELLERGIEVSPQDSIGKTPLHKALQTEHTEVASLLIEHGADLSIEDEYGNQPLWRAVFKADYEMSRQLLEAGADPTHKNDVEKSPLDMAEDAQAEEFIELLRRYC